MRKTLLVAACLVPSLAAAQGLEPGQWEFSTTMTMEGMPKPQMQTMQRCVTKEEARNPERWMGKRGEQSECNVKQNKVSASEVRWNISCPKQNMSGSGSARLGKGEMESEQVMRGNMQGRDFEVRMKMSGRRLGPCKS